MKKFKTKLKILRNVLIIIIAIFFIIVGRKVIILAKLFNTSTELYDKNNYEQIAIGENAWVPNDLNNYLGDGSIKCIVDVRNNTEEN